LVGHILEKDGIDVLEAADAGATLTVWREQRPDVIVLDHKMPPDSGFAVAEQILAEDPAQVIFLFTAFVDAEITAKSEDLGITLCLGKDRVFDIPELVRAHVNRG
jgi:CheY-like chemotaxis protein